jgi:uncharacterized protein (DUF1697 family)
MLTEHEELCQALRAEYAGGMAILIALLRGVNLGKRRMKMERLRDVCAELGWTGVKTYVQSGNVVFRTRERGVERAAKRLEEAIQTEWGFHSQVVIRTEEEMRGVVARSPFVERKGLNPSQLAVTFLAEELGAVTLEKLGKIEAAPEEFVVSGREIYSHFPNGLARSKLAVEMGKALKDTGTARNWNTVLALTEMAGDLARA